MNVLFVCRGNVARSQMAEAIFNYLYERYGHSATSAGTEAEGYAQGTLANVCSEVVECMGEIRIDLSDKMPKQLAEEAVRKADRVIVMAETETLPLWIYNYSNRIELWEVPDPINGDVAYYKGIRDYIGMNVIGLRDSLVNKTL